MGIVNTRQILKANNKTKLLEINDKLSANTFVEEKGGVLKSTVHSKFSRIGVTIVDWTNGKKDKAIILNHNLTPEIAKMLSQQIIQGNINMFQNQGFSEQKIDCYSKDQNGFSKVSIFRIQFQPKMNNPWVVYLENGIGKVVKNQNGGINIQSASYKKQQQSRVVIAFTDMLVKMQQLRDYITCFETCHTNSMLKNRAVYENKLREENKNK